MFVCTGNTCRSAMAHHMLEKMIKEKDNVEVYSCGIYADSGEPATYSAIDVMKEYGVDMNNHRATNIKETKIEQMDLILCATVSHKQIVLNMYPELTGKVYTLKELGGRMLSYGKASGENGYYVPVTFEFDNKGDVIPGSFVEVFLLSSPMENVLSLPHSALTEEQGSFFVYLQLDEEGYKKQLVTLGADNGESVQILSGIKAGDRVVTQGAYQVKLASATNAIPAHSHEH